MLVIAWFGVPLSWPRIGGGESVEWVGHEYDFAKHSWNHGEESRMVACVVQPLAPGRSGTSGQVPRRARSGGPLFAER